MDASLSDIVSIGAGCAGIIGAWLAYSTMASARAKDAADVARKDERSTARLDALEKRSEALERRADSHDETREELAVMKESVAHIQGSMQRLEAAVSKVGENLSELARTLAAAGLRRGNAE